MEPLFKGAKKFKFGEWVDRQILPGQKWRDEIEEGLKGAKFGVLMLSPQFFASGFIAKNELPALLEKQMVVPVMLHAVLLDGSAELRGLEDRQIFRDSKGRAFEDCRTKPDQRRFARELFQTIVALLEKYEC